MLEESYTDRRVLRGGTHARERASANAAGKQRIILISNLGVELVIITS